MKRHYTLGFIPFFLYSKVGYYTNHEQEISGGGRTGGSGPQDGGAPQRGGSANMQDVATIANAAINANNEGMLV